MNVKLIFILTISLFVEIVSYFVLPDHIRIQCKRLFERPARLHHYSVNHVTSNLMSQLSMAGVTEHLCCCAATCPSVRRSAESRLQIHNYSCCGLDSWLRKDNTRYWSNDSGGLRAVWLALALRFVTPFAVTGSDLHNLCTYM